MTITAHKTGSMTITATNHNNGTATILLEIRLARYFLKMIADDYQKRADCSQQKHVNKSVVDMMQAHYAEYAAQARAAATALQTNTGE